ncbi:hypothetical protein PCANC_01862 [Puccinia coronata f. sp. avenae]|uniref:Uncharacterized protein n=1 Tax=Puccinia coronata f. sp. avenae TaxID=200324 RepID=A0A2N5W565_9BASI|nr:hypothetical protein PCANC_01862 [Puccinia coronata f. sp. avenae]
MVKDVVVKFPDVRLEWKDLVHQAFNKAKMRGELEYPNNPYIMGGAKEDLDPYTGTKKFVVTKRKAKEAKNKQQANNNRQNGNRWEPYRQNQDRDEYNGNRGRNNNRNRHDGQNRSNETITTNDMIIGEGQEATKAQATEARTGNPNKGKSTLREPRSPQSGKLTLATNRKMCRP